MKKRYFKAFVLLACFAAAFPPPCGHAAEPPPGRLVLSVPTDPKTFNPLTAQETSSTEITGLMFEGLTRFDPRDGGVKPGLAESWEVSADGKEWVFHLRPGVRWSDGQAFRAEDVLFTFGLIYDPDVPAASRDIFLVKGKPMTVKKLDESRVSFTLPEPFAPFLLSMSQPILPSHVLERPYKEGNFASQWGIREAPDRIVGTGPFRLASYEPGQRIVLARNPFYWKKDEAGRQQPYLEGIIFLVISSPDVTLLKFLEGELDAYRLRGQDYPVLKPEESRRGFSLFRTGPGMGSSFLVLNQGASEPHKKQWFTDAVFRRALAHGMDRKSMNDIVFNGLGVLQCSPLSPSTPFFYNEDVTCHDYDPEKARKMLSGAGYKDRDGDGILEDGQGNAVEFLLYTNADNPDRSLIAQILREDIAKLGMKVHLVFLEFNALVTKLMATGDWDAVLIGFTGSPDPHFGSNVWRTEGRLHFWEKPEQAGELQRVIDTIFETAAGEMDRGKRKALYDEWQLIVSRELPHIYTILPEVIYAVRERVRHAAPTVLGGALYNIEEIELTA